MRTRLIALAVAAGLAAGPAAAVGPDIDESGNADLDRATVLVDAGAYRSAIRLLDRARQQERNSADVYNLPGFANRELGNIDAAFAFYARAPEIDPDHLGANEYLGELYLQLGELEKAQERLATLAAACDRCEEFRELEAAIATHAGP